MWEIVVRASPFTATPPPFAGGVQTCRTNLRILPAKINERIRLMNVSIELYAKDSRVAILRDGTRLPVSRSGYQRLRELL